MLKTSSPSGCIEDYLTQFSRQFFVVEKHLQFKVERLKQTAFIYLAGFAWAAFLALEFQANF
jgi:hypothetical protein